MPFPGNRNSHLLFRQRVIFMCKCAHKCLLYMCGVCVCVCVFVSMNMICFRIGLGWIGWLFGIFSVWPPIHILCCLRRQALTHTHACMEMEKCCVEFCANKNNMLQPLHISEWLRLNRIQYANQNETFLSIDEQTAISSPPVRIVCQPSSDAGQAIRSLTRISMLTPAHTHCAPLIFFVSHHHFHLLKHILKEIKSSFS